MQIDEPNWYKNYKIGAINYVCEYLISQISNRYFNG